MRREKDVAWLSSFTVTARVPSPRKGTLLELRDAVRVAALPAAFQIEGPGGDGLMHITCAAYLREFGDVDPERLVDRVARAIHKFTGRTDS
jgi:hypothetical protein